MGSDTLALVLATAALTVLGWRVEHIVRAWLASRDAFEARTLAIREREVALAEQRAQGSEEMPPLPLDLVGRVNGETEPWAREQVQSLVQQLWRKHKAWDAVRSELATLDAHAVMAEQGWSQTGLLS
jgi:hypothetical protein